LSGLLRPARWPFGTRILCQATVLQFWNPEFLRKFRTGVVNGSLKSVSVEIQFYVVIWFVYRALRGLSQARLTIALAFGPLNAFKSEIGSMLDAEFGTTLGSKLYRASFVPWFYLFMLGVVAQRCADWVVPLLRDRCMPTVATYAVCMLIDYSLWGIPLGNEIPAYLVPIMGVTVLALAYRQPSLGSRLLRGNDVSYGFYVYHMPLINLLMYLGAPRSLPSCLAALVGALVLAALS
jgi:peptidoglycan/LPS O-acetylase OafA/YrhL